MEKDSEQVTKFLSTQFLIILGTLSLFCCIAIYLRTELSGGLGSIGAIVGIFLCAVSARNTKETKDRVLLVLSGLITFALQIYSLQLNGFF